MKRFLSALIASIVFIIVLLTVYVIHIKFFRINVIFYAAIGDAFIAAIVTAIIAWSTQCLSRLSNLERAQLLLIWLLLGYAFAISIPTVIDRSLSFYILEKVQQRGGGISLDAFEGVFTKEYVREHRLVDVRLTEQIESGTITIQNGCVILTSKGHHIAGFSRYFRQHWLPKERLLMGKYSDDLTDPFRNGADKIGYECK